MAVWNVDQARQDFECVMEVDNSLTLLVKKELANLDALIQAKNEEDKQKYKNLFK